MSDPVRITCPPPAGPPASLVVDQFPATFFSWATCNGNALLMTSGGTWSIGNTLDIVGTITALTDPTQQFPISVGGSVLQVVNLSEGVAVATCGDPLTIGGALSFVGDGKDAVDVLFPSGLPIEASGTLTFNTDDGQMPIGTSPLGKSLLTGLSTTLPLEVKGIINYAFDNASCVEWTTNVGESVAVSPTGTICIEPADPAGFDINVTGSLLIDGSIDANLSGTMDVSDTVGITIQTKEDSQLFLSSGDPSSAIVRVNNLIELQPADGQIDVVTTACLNVTTNCTQPLLAEIVVTEGLFEVEGDAGNPINIDACLDIFNVDPNQPFQVYSVFNSDSAEPCIRRAPSADVSQQPFAVSREMRDTPAFNRTFSVKFPVNAPSTVRCVTALCFQLNTADNASLQLFAVSNGKVVLDFSINFADVPNITPSLGQTQGSLYEWDIASLTGGGVVLTQEVDTFDVTIVGSPFNDMLIQASGFETCPSCPIVSLNTGCKGVSVVGNSITAFTLNGDFDSILVDDVTASWQVENVCLVQNLITSQTFVLASVFNDVFLFKMFDDEPSEQLTLIECVTDSNGDPIVLGTSPVDTLLDIVFSEDTNELHALFSDSGTNDYYVLPNIDLETAQSSGLLQSISVTGGSSASLASTTTGEIVLIYEDNGSGTIQVDSLDPTTGNTSNLFNFSDVTLPPGSQPIFASHNRCDSSIALVIESTGVPINQLWKIEVVPETATFVAETVELNQRGFIAASVDNIGKSGNIIQTGLERDLFI